MANVWLIYLEGGDWCYSAETCATRYKVGPQFMTTNGARPRSGIVVVRGKRGALSWRRWETLRCPRLPCVCSSNVVDPPDTQRRVAGWPGVVSLGGIMSSNPDKSPWAGANKIYVGYCSSDGAQRSSNRAPAPRNFS